MKDDKCNELYGEIALRNHAFFNEFSRPDSSVASCAQLQQRPAGMPTCPSRC